MIDRQDEQVQRYYINSLCVAIMSNLEVVLDPIAILEMTAYHSKHEVGRLFNATFGLLYGQQVELKYHISLSAPLGTNKENDKQLIQRYLQYNKLRLKRSKTTVNFYEEYTLLGAYIMRPITKENQKLTEAEDKKLFKMSEQLINNGAPYALIVDSTVTSDPILYMNLKPCSYSTEIKKNERLCLDSIHSSNASELAALKHTIAKKKVGIEVFNEKLSLLLKRIEGVNPSDEALRKLDQLLNDYDRISVLSNKNKKKSIQAMNYSVVTGIVIDRLVKN